jgi:hypothetical protein
LATKTKAEKPEKQEAIEQSRMKIVTFRVTSEEEVWLHKLTAIDYMPTVGGELRKLIRKEAERYGLIPAGAAPMHLRGEELAEAKK